MSEIPFVLSLDGPTYYGHDMFPNRIYRQLHARHHDSLDLHTLGLIARLGAHGHRMHNRKLAEGGNGTFSKNDKNEFEVNLDVGYFEPNELTVKIVNDCVVVEGKHEEREDDHGFIARHFARRYELPKSCNVDDIISTLSSDGVLTVRVPKPKLADKGNERVIEIKQIGPSDLFLKNNKKSEEEPKKDG